MFSGLNREKCCDITQAEDGSCAHISREISNLKPRATDRPCPLIFRAAGRASYVQREPNSAPFVVQHSYTNRIIGMCFTVSCNAASIYTTVLKLWVAIFEPRSQELFEIHLYSHKSLASQ